MFENRDYWIRLSWLAPSLRRPLVRIYNAMLWRVPYGVKYGLAEMFRRRALPYSLLRKGDTVIIVGAARDLIRAGRSRSVIMARLVGSTGKVVVMEGDPASAAALGEYAGRHGLKNFAIRPKGAWDRDGHVEFTLASDHPAGNKVRESGDPDDLEERTGEHISIPVERLDQVMDAENIEKVRLVSVTTNGTEYTVLKGLGERISACDAISVARAWNRPSALRLLGEHGFSKISRDDRGITFARGAVLADGDSSG